MSIPEIRNHLHEYINKADDHLLQLLYKIASTYSEKHEDDHIFSEEDIQEFERRRQSRIAGTSATFPLHALQEKLIPKI